MELVWKIFSLWRILPDSMENTTRTLFWPRKEKLSEKNSETVKEKYILENVQLI